MNILGIDTSINTATAAIINADKILSSEIIDNKLTHSITSLPQIKRVIDNSELTLDDINYIAVANGPGSFTGLRIGMSIAKGLAFDKDIKIIPISTLDGLCYNYYNCRKYLCPIIDARNSNVYTSLNTFENGMLKKVIDEEAKHIDDLINKLKEIDGDILFLGDAINIHKNKIISNLPKGKVQFAPPTLSMPKAESVAYAAMNYIKNNNDAMCDLKINYLRMPQAQRVRIENKNSK